MRTAPVHGIKAGGERSFGFVFTAVFALISLFPLFYGEDLRLWSAVAGAVVLFLTVFVPKSLKTPNRIWFRFGMLLGSVVSPVVMALLFFLVVLPTGVFLRLFGKDVLSLKMNKSADTYWIERNVPAGSMRDQF